MKKNDRCPTCTYYNNCKDSFASWIFFIIGLFSTIAIRIVTVLVDFNPWYGKIAWYCGVLGFFVFFIYKYRVESFRARAITQHQLLQKIHGKKNLTEEDFSLLGTLLCALNSRKDRINYFVIFSSSILAFFVAIYFDFFR